MAVSKASANAITPAAKGAIAIGSGTNAASILTVGSDNQVLTADSTQTTGVKWAAASSPTAVGVACYLGTTTAVAQGTGYKIPWTEYIDTDGFHSDSTNNTRLTVPTGKGGKYLISVQVVFATTTSGSMYGTIEKNGSYGSSAAQFLLQRGSGLNDSGGASTFMFDLVAGDYLEVVVVQNSGGNLNLYGNSDAYKVTSVCMTYLGA